MSDFHRLVERRFTVRCYPDRRSRRSLQDTLLRAIAKEHLWQTGQISSLVFTIMHNQYVNIVRGRCATRQPSISTALISLVATPIDGSRIA